MMVLLSMSDKLVTKDMSDQGPLAQEEAELTWCSLRRWDRQPHIIWRIY